MKLYLASFLQKENFGPGKLIGICHGAKPKHLPVNEQFTLFAPSKSLLEEYYQVKNSQPIVAAEVFVSGYRNQLESAVYLIQEEAKQVAMSPIEILPFKDGDTLCSWERAEFTNYRKILAPYLQKLGYEVVLN